MERPLQAKLTLPSGRQVALSTLADPARPWRIQESSGACLVVRAWRGDSSRLEIYKESGRTEPLLLDERDARALAKVLDARPRVRARASPDATRR